MHPDPTEPPRLGATRLISASFRLLFEHFGVLFPLAFAPALLLEAVNLAILPQDADGRPPGGAAFFVAYLLSTLVGYLVTAAMCLAALDAVIGSRHTLGEYVGRATRNLLPIVVLGTAVSLAAGIAALFFIVPGLYVLAQFFVWVPVLVFEDAGLGALGRAQALTKGHRWPLVGAMVLLVLLVVAASMAVVPLLAAAAAAPGNLLFALGAAAVQAIYFALVGIYVALVYVRLREIKEGLAPRDLAGG
jgi:hypothetical protein